VNENEQLAVYT